MDNCKPKYYQEVLDRISSAFLKHGINLHIDSGSESIDYSTKKSWGSLSESNFIDYTDDYYLGSTENNFKSWIALYNKNLSDARKLVFYHCTIFDTFTYETDEGEHQPRGASFVGGSDIAISLSKIDGTKGSPYYKYQLAVAIMHEFGHALGLEHGGDVDLNYRPQCH